jgi:Zn-dependent M28 family amino/carboxypeptidase
VDRLEKDVLRLTSHGKRQVGSQGHRAAREYLVDRMTELGIRPYRDDFYELPYGVSGTEFVNLIGRIQGSARDRDPILIGAHYDTCGPIPGADDNASAVAIVLAVVEKLRSASLGRDLIIAFFDAEEPPYFLTDAMGSIYFFSRQRTEEIACAVILDLVGHDVPIPGFEDLLFITGMESHSALEDVIKSTPENDRIRIVPALNEYVGDLSDHHIFRVNDVPYLFLSCGRWEHYHMPTDTPEKLNYEKMAAIADYLANLIISSDGAKFSQGLTSYDSTPTELQYMNSVFSDLFQMYGIGKLQSREDIDRVVRMMIATYGV